VRTVPVSADPNQQGNHDDAATHPETPA
jgi:hypothetical protein